MDDPSFSSTTNQYMMTLVEDESVAMKEMEMLRGENSFEVLRPDPTFGLYDHSLVQHHHHQHMNMQHELPHMVYSNIPRANPSLQEGVSCNPVDPGTNTTMKQPAPATSPAADGEASAAPPAEQTRKLSAGDSSEEQKRRGKETFQPGDDVEVHDIVVPRTCAEKHNLSEKRRRDRINSRMTDLFDLVPNCHYQANKYAMFDEATKYLTSLQHRNQELETLVEYLQQQKCHGMVAPSYLQQLEQRNQELEAMVELLQLQLKERCGMAAPTYQLTLERRNQELEARVESLEHQLQEFCTRVAPPYP